MYLNRCKLTEKGDKVEITGPCMVTGKPYTLTVKRSELETYSQGAFVQDAFPNLSCDEREFIISGYSPEGWNQAFPPDEDE